ncbi:MAG TPA: energy transducer TonB [Candidatus Cloacimonadota bacterium]|nr:energy transducer TonB [Candidatus Cloacimonadota bacterium]
MANKIVDWKDIADSFYDKSFSLAILILLFGFIVSPEIEVKPYERVVIQESVVIDIPEIKEKIKPPEETVKPVVEIIVEDDLESDEEEDIEIIETIEKTTLDAYEEVTENIVGKTSKFVVYEEPPFVIRRVPPTYSDFAKKSGIQGDVWLEVEVFTDGSVGAIEVKQSLMSGSNGLDDAAIKAVKQWEFSPATSGGKPVACWVTFPVGFYLDK